MSQKNMRHEGTEARRHEVHSAAQYLCAFVPTCLCALFSLAGCQTDRVTTSDGWPMPPTPRAAPQPPAAMRADRMAFTVGSKPDDTNNNGFPDSIKVSVSLFSSQHPTALQQDGSFTFAMYRQGEFGTPDAQPMFQWQKDDQMVKQSQANTIAGPCYLFQLSLLEFGTDRLPLERADLVCEFQSADQSSRVRSDGVRTIQIGRRVSSQ